MTKRMLIDASHPEETRVVVLDGSKVEEFDFEAASKRPLKGNIYLAKVTRVEPSLQAAFVEYGGNRQGFLAFAEIHPDYYQIPVADRQALLAEQEAEARRRQEDDIESFEITGSSSDDAESDEETEEEADTGEEQAEMAPLVPLDAAPETDDVPSAEEEDSSEPDQEQEQPQRDDDERQGQDRQDRLHPHVHEREHGGGDEQRPPVVAVGDAGDRPRGDVEGDGVAGKAQEEPHVTVKPRRSRPRAPR